MDAFAQGAKLRALLGALMIQHAEAFELPLDRLALDGLDPEWVLL